MSAPHVVKVPTLNRANAGAFGTNSGVSWLRVISRPPVRSIHTAPQQYTVPIVVRAQVLCSPVLTEATGALIRARTGPDMAP